MREKLANLCHEQWSDWMVYLFSKCTMVGGKAIIPKWAVTRWREQINTLYSDLSPSEKDSDRVEADKFLAVFKESTKSTHNTPIKCASQIADKLVSIRGQVCENMSVAGYDDLTWCIRQLRNR